MSEKNAGAQTINCGVSSCAFHEGGENVCGLRGVHIEPMYDAGSGQPWDESMCGSYRKR